MADTTMLSATGAAGFSYLERFEVYRAAIEFQTLVPRLVPRSGFADLRNQLERASVSIVLNLAEGLGRYSRAEKAHFYRIANGSALESAAALDVLAARRVIDPTVHRDAQALLALTGQMLTKLILRIQP